MNPKEYEDLVNHNKSLGLTATQIQTELKKLTAKYKQLTDELKAAKKNNDPNYEALKAAYPSKALQLRQEMNSWSAANTQANLKENL
jgi:hypothetical protein